MILGVGIDLVKVERMESWVNSPQKMEKFFGKEELADIEKAGVGKIQSIAARFAAKEAFGKALGTGLVGFQLNEVQVVKDGAGRPSYKLSGRAMEKLIAIGGKDIFLSISHEKEFAVAVAVLESV